MSKGSIWLIVILVLIVVLLVVYLYGGFKGEKTGFNVGYNLGFDVGGEKAEEEFIAEDLTDIQEQASQATLQKAAEEVNPFKKENPLL